MAMVSIAHASLRERKKQRTRATIAQVALDLFHEQGFHETTIAQIAEAANVSPRTVSSYFPAKEDLAFPDRGSTFAGLQARLEERRPGETAADAIRDWIAGELPRWKREGEVTRKRQQVITGDPGLLAHQQAMMLEGEQLIAAAIARDLDAAPEELEPRMAAAATFAIFNVIGEHRAPADAGDEECSPVYEDAAAAMALVERALRFVAAGIRALRDEPDPAADAQD